MGSSLAHALYITGAYDINYNTDSEKLICTETIKREQPTCWH